jgi:acetyl esterase/lipase
MVLAIVGGRALGQTAPAAPARTTPPETKPAASEPSGADSYKGIVVKRNVEYAKPDDKPVALDLYLPKTSDGPVPLVIWIHGGGWQAGSKNGCPAVPFVRDGFAVASVDYRLTDRARFPAQIHDCKAAVRYLRAHANEYNLDPARFGAWGASAGGHLVAMLGCTCGNAECEGSNLGNEKESSAVQCVCDWFGPTDFTVIKESANDPYNVGAMLTKLFGGKMSEKQDLVKLASPSLHVKKTQTPGMKIPPFLIVQGDKDPLVPMEQSRELSDKLKEAGVEQELVIVEGQGHGFLGDSRTTEFKRVRDFFVKQLKPAKPSAEKKPDVKSSKVNCNQPQLLAQRFEWDGALDWRADWQDELK